MRLLLLSVLFGLFVLPPVWADTGTATTTLTIAPSASSGATITAADENSRSSDTSTHANNHLHRLSNTTNFGDGGAGNKQLCADAADSTDACIRWNDTANLWQVDNPVAGTFNQIATITNTNGITANQVVIGDGTSSLRGTSGGSSGQVLTHQGSSIPTWTTFEATIADRIVVTSSDTTTSSTLSDVVGMTVTMTNVAANPVLVGWVGRCKISATDGAHNWNIQIDDSSLALGTTGIKYVGDSTADEDRSCGFTIMTADQTAASHTYDLQFSNDDGADTVTLTCGSASNCNMWAVEVTD